MLLAKLRQATAQAHERLESDLDLLRADLTRRDYFQLLRSMYAFIAPWEMQVGALLGSADRAMFDARRKSELLVDDLRFAHERELADVAKDSLLRTAPRDCLPRLSTAADAWGSWYVVEGSTLGGEILARHFRAKWGLLPGGGLSYFSCYGRDVGKKWSEFAVAATVAVPRDSYGAAAAAAVATFEHLHAWLVAKPITVSGLPQNSDVSQMQ
ncbi:MAG: heme oxygenase [Pirellula sp.]|nr:heme oxygenase [Pirellula sp.]